MIARSKERKREKQQLKGQQDESTAKLNDELGDLLGHLQFRETGIKAKPPLDEFDKTVRELNFASRSKPTDRIKTGTVCGTGPGACHVRVAFRVC